MFNKIKKINCKYIKPWFFASDTPDKIKPVRCAITIFICLIIITVVDKLCNPNRLSDSFVLGLFGQLGLLMGMDVWKSNADKKYTVTPNQTQSDTTYQSANKDAPTPAQID